MTGICLTSIFEMQFVLYTDTTEIKPLFVPKYVKLQSGIYLNKMWTN